VRIGEAVANRERLWVSWAEDLRLVGEQRLEDRDRLASALGSLIRIAPLWRRSFMYWRIRSIDRGSTIRFADFARARLGARRPRC
jgi:hypothetical protein